MSTAILKNGLQSIARRDCPCMCCRHTADIARVTLDAHESSVVIPPQLPGNAVLVDAAEGRELFHHPV